MQRSAVVFLCLVAYAGGYDPPAQPPAIGRCPILPMLTSLPLRFSGYASAVTAEVNSGALVQQQQHPAQGTPGTSLWQGLRKLLQSASSSTSAQASFGNRKSGCAAAAGANAGVQFGVATADTTAQAYCWGKAARKQQKEAEKQQKEWEKEQKKLYRKAKKDDHDDYGKHNKKGGNNWGYWQGGYGKGDSGKGGKGKNGWGRKFL